MTKRLNENQKFELERLRNWSMIIIDFITAKKGLSPGLAMAKNTINDCYNSQNMKGIKYIFNDVNEWAKGLSLNEQNDLNESLKNTFNEDLNKIDATNITDIEKIKSKGIIVDENEYRLVLNYVEEIYSDENMKTEVDKLNMLLAQFHKA